MSTLTTTPFPDYLEVKEASTPEENEKTIEAAIEKFGSGNYSNPIEIQLDGNYKTVIISLLTMNSVNEVFHDIYLKMKFSGTRGSTTTGKVINWFIDSTREATTTILLGSKHLGGLCAHCIIIDAVKEGYRKGITEKFDQYSQNCHQPDLIKNVALAMIRSAVGIDQHDINGD